MDEEKDILTKASTKGLQKWRRKERNWLRLCDEIQRWDGENKEEVDVEEVVDVEEDDDV